MPSAVVFDLWGLPVQSRLARLCSRSGSFPGHGRPRWHCCPQELLRGIGTSASLEDASRESTCRFRRRRPLRRRTASLQGVLGARLSRIRLVSECHQLLQAGQRAGRADVVSPSNLLNSPVNRLSESLDPLAIGPPLAYGSCVL